MGGKTEGIIAASLFSTFSSLDIHSTRNSNCNISHYTLYHIPLTAKIEELQGNGCSFSSSIQDCIKHADSGDKYVFLNIKVACEGDNKAFRVNNLNFNIK